MKKYSLVLPVLLFTVLSHAQNVGIGTSSPNAYGHGGTNRLLEINNSGTDPNSQSHLVLSSASTLGSVGTLTWSSPGIGLLEKRVGIIGVSFDPSNTPALFRSNMNFYTNDGGSLVERMRITYDGNVGIGTTSPRAPLSMAPTVGQKIILWDDGNVAGNNYGIGVQGGALQIHSYTSGDNIVFGYGRSAALTERMRIINSGADALLVNGRLLLKNGTFPNDPAYGPGVWLYKPDNLGQLLGFMGAQDNQNMGFYGGTNGWGLTYNAINSRVGINTTNPTSLLDVNGQITVDQKNFGGYGGLLLKGNVPGSNYPNIAFTIKNNAPTPADIVGAMIQGDLVNNAANAESIDLNFLTTNNGFGSLSEKLRIKGNGAVSFSGNAGNTGQFLTSNGNNAAPVWKSLSDYITTVVSGSANLQVTGTTVFNLPACDLTINLARPATVMLFSRIALQKNCAVGSCDSKAQVTIFLNGVSNTSYGVIGANYGGETQNNYTTNYCGPEFYSLPAGTHTFTFTAANMFNEPQLSYTARVIIISN